MALNDKNGMTTLPGNPNQQAQASTLPRNPNQTATATPLGGTNTNANNNNALADRKQQMLGNTNSTATTAPQTGTATTAPVQNNTQATTQPATNNNQQTQPQTQPQTSPNPAVGTYTKEQAEAYVNGLNANDSRLQLSEWDLANLTPEQQQIMLQAKKAYLTSELMGDTTGQTTSHATAEGLRSPYQYSGGTYGNEYLPWGNGNGDGNGNGNGNGNNGPISADQLSANLTDRLKEIYEAGIKQANGEIDYGVDQAAKELQRAWEDAQAEFRTRQNQVSAEEGVNKDNAALYAEMRGDRGGIGQDQYTDVMNTAAINRQTIQSEQTKLSTDTARQIADLRAQGEFKKADALLQLTQTYLSNLLDLEQFAANYGLSVAQFNETVREFEKEFALSAAQITGTYNGNPTYQAQQDQKKWDYQLAQDSKEDAVNVVNTLINMGMPITAEQAKAAGFDETFAAYYNQMLQAKASGSGGGRGTGNDDDDYGDDGSLANIPWTGYYTDADGNVVPGFYVQLTDYMRGNHYAMTADGAYAAMSDLAGDSLSDKEKSDYAKRWESDTAYWDSQREKNEQSLSFMNGIPLK